jgi:hypothetical protein
MIRGGCFLHPKAYSPLPCFKWTRPAKRFPLSPGRYRIEEDEDGTPQLRPSQRRRHRPWPGTPFTPGRAAHSPVRCRASRTTVTCYQAATNILAIESSVVTPLVRRAVNRPGGTTMIHVSLNHWTPEPPPEWLPRSFRRTARLRHCQGPPLPGKPQNSCIMPRRIILHVLEGGGG